MTDHNEPHDELASAHLDGELSADEQAATMSDAQLLARVERLASARDAVRGTEITIDPARREDAIAAALAAFDDERGAPAAATDGGGSVVDLAEAADRRRTRRMLRLTGAAAAVALLALAVPFLGRLDSGSNEEQVAGPAESSADMSLRTDDAAAGAMADALAAAPAPGFEHLGPFADLTELSDAVRFRLGAASAGDTPTEGGGATGADTAGEAEPCASQQADHAPLVFLALAELDGREVLVLVREDQASGRTLIVLDVSSCAVVATQQM